MAIDGVGFDSKETLQAFIDKIKSQRGELVPSVSYYQKGTLNVSSLEASASTTIDVTLPTAMPDADYIVVYRWVNADIGNMCYTKRISASGFTIEVVNVNDTAYQGTAILAWQAFKLMTDESRALDEQAIQQNTSDIADLSAYTYTRLTSTDNIDSIITPGNYGGYNGDNIGGTFPYTGNGQFAITVVKARDYVYQICHMDSITWQRYASVSGTTLNWNDWNRVALYDEKLNQNTTVQGIVTAQPVTYRSFTLTDTNNVSHEYQPHCMLLISREEVILLNVRIHSTDIAIEATKISGGSDNITALAYSVDNTNHAVTIYATLTTWAMTFSVQKITIQNIQPSAIEQISSVPSGATALAIKKFGLENGMVTGTAAVNNTNTFTFDLPSLASGDAWEITVSAQTWGLSSGFVTKYIASRSNENYRIANCGGASSGFTVTISGTTVTFVWSNTDNTIAYWRARYTKLV